MHGRKAQQLSAMYRVTTSRRKKLVSISAAVAFGLFRVGSAKAQSYGWDPGRTPASPSGGTGNWNASGGLVNWSNGTSDIAWPNANTDVAVFGGTAGTVTLSGTNIANALVFNTSGYSLTNDSTGALTLSGTTPTITANANATISAPITDTVSLTTAGAGVLTLSGSNTGISTNTVNITAGELVMGSFTALGSESNSKIVTVSSGATLDTNGYSTSNATGSGLFNTLNIAGTGVGGIGALYNPAGGGGYAYNGGLAQNFTVNLTADATINLGNDFVQLGGGYGTTYLTLNGNTLTKNGNGNYFLVNTTVSNGNINITNGQIILRHAGGSNGSRIQGTGVITTSGGYLSLDSYQTAGLITRQMNLSGGGLISTGNAQVDSPITLLSGSQIYLEGGNLTATGVIAGSAGISINAYLDPGTSSAIFTGANTYSGGTSINNNALLANTNASTGSATGSGLVTINSGSTLAGGTTANPGNISGGVTVNSGATISAGTGSTTTSTIGTLQTGSETWSSGGKYAVKIGATNGSSDELIMSGLTNATTAGGFTIQVTGTSSSSFYGGFKYVIADDTGAGLNNANAFNLSSLSLTTTPSAPAASNFALSETGDGGTGEELVLTDTAAPEPTSALLLGVVAAPLLLGRNRRYQAALLDKQR